MATTWEAEQGQDAHWMGWRVKYFEEIFYLTVDDGYSSGGVLGVSMCRECGSLVVEGNENEHRAWHDKAEGGNQA